MIEQIFEKINSLSRDAQNAAIQKAEELSFDPNKGGIPLIESFTNLNLARETLKDGIEKQKLVQLPITLQKELIEQLTNVSRFLTSLTSGADEVVNLTNAIEKLNTIIWQWGLHNLSDEFLGYQTKLNQVKQLEVELQKLREELEQGLILKKSLSETLTEAQKSDASLKEVLRAAETAKASAEDHAGKALKAKQDADASLTMVQKIETTSNEQIKLTTSNASSVTAKEAEIKKFFDEIEAFRKKIASTITDAQETVKSNNEEAAKLTGKLSGLENQIKDQIERATGFTLFQSFQKRQESIARSKMFWVWALGVVVVVSLGITSYVIQTTSTFDSVFYMKLSFSLPLIFAITFCVVQYSRERRLEEEYAFRSNISISLNPYQELVGKLIDKNIAAEREKFTSFILESVSRVFTSPTDKVFDSPHKDSGDTDKALKQVTSMVKIVAKSLKQ